MRQLFLLSLKQPSDSPTDCNLKDDRLPFQSMAERWVFDSSNVVEAKYDSEEKLLTVEFVRGRRYVFRRVPPTLWKEFKASASPGSFVSERLSKYKFRQVDS